MRVGHGWIRNRSDQDWLMEEISQAAAAVGKIPSGLFIVTSNHNGQKEGYLGSWIQQVSFSPLLIQISMRPGRPCYDAIKAGGRFCVNVVGQKNGGMMKPFWNPDKFPDPFAELDHRGTPRSEEHTSELQSRENLV